VWEARPCLWDVAVTKGTSGAAENVSSLRRLSQQVDLSHATSQKTVKIDQITKENDLLSLVGLVNEQRSSGFILLQ
jgi:hypothetical protein